MIKVSESLKFLTRLDDHPGVENKLNQPRMNCRVSGKGESVILLHGFAGNVSHWESLRPLLSKYYRVIIPDLSQLTLGKNFYSFSDQVDHLAALIKRQSPENPTHIVGLSYGGALAWGLSVKYPQLINRVVLVNPLPPDPLNCLQWTSLRFILKMPFHSFLLPLLLKSKWGQGLLIQSAEIFRNVDEEADTDRVKKLSGRRLNLFVHLIYRFTQILKSENWSTWKSNLKDWKKLTLFIYEEGDPLIRAQVYEEFADSISCSDRLITEGAGHISPLNYPHMITWEVMKFLISKESREFSEKQEKLVVNE